MAAEFPQQTPALPPHHVTLSMKIIMLIFALVVVGALAWFVWDYKNAPDDTDYSASKVTKSETAATETATETTKTETEAEAVDNGVACGDKAYAYELTFASPLWDKKVVKEYKPANDEAIIYCYFTVPTTSTDDVWTASAQDHDAKYASVFAVGVYTPAQWAIAKKEPNAGTELGKKGGYVWNYSNAQALPDDLQANKIADDVKNVVATFKISQ